MEKIVSQSKHCEIFKFDFEELLSLGSYQEGFFKLVPLKQSTRDQYIVRNNTSFASVTENGGGKWTFGQMIKFNFILDREIEIELDIMIFDICI